MLDSGTFCLCAYGVWRPSVCAQARVCVCVCVCVSRAEEGPLWSPGGHGGLALVSAGLAGPGGCHQERGSMASARLLGEGPLAHSTEEHRAWVQLAGPWNSPGAHRRVRGCCFAQGDSAPVLRGGWRGHGSVLTTYHLEGQGRQSVGGLEGASPPSRQLRDHPQRSFSLSNLCLKVATGLASHEPLVVTGLMGAGSARNQLGAPGGSWDHLSPRLEDHICGDPSPPSAPSPWCPWPPPHHWSQSGGPDLHTPCR